MQENLFVKSANNLVYDYGPKGILVYCPFFFSIEDRERLFKSLLRTVKWQQDKINIMGKLVDIPRLTAWYGENNNQYVYSGIKMYPHKITKDIRFIKDKIENISSSKFNSVLLNQYRNGNDSVDWHSDDEKELDPKAEIASVSFGSERDFQIKYLEKGAKLKNITLAAGSLVIMKPPFQENFIHRVPKRKNIVKPRINLTFRVIR